MRRTLAAHIAEYRLAGPLMLLLILLLVMLIIGGVMGRIGWATAAWVVLVLIVLVPRFQVRGGELKEKERLDAENGARQAVVQLAGGVLLFTGAWITWAQLQEQHKANASTASVAEQNLKLTAENLKVTEENLRLTKQTQTTERFTRALDQINSERLQVRLGAIYLLGRISRDSPPDQWAIMEILTTFVRERSPWNRKSAGGPQRRFQMPNYYVLPKEQRIGQDIQAALTVLGANAWASAFVELESRARHGFWRTWMDLSEADLRGADLMDFQAEPGIPTAKLRSDVRVNLQRTHLEGAQLRSAHLEGASLIGAHLDGAWMEYAWLNNTKIQIASLNGARLDSASLEHADLDSVSARGASLMGVDAKSAILAGDFTDAALDLANLREAHLSGVFVGADLSGAVLSGADVGHADFTRANFDKTDLRGVNLRNPNSPGDPPRGLTVEQLRSAITDQSTLFPDYLKMGAPKSASPAPTPSPSPSRP